MDQFPTEEEEFELMYQDELENLEDLEGTSVNTLMKPSENFASTSNSAPYKPLSAALNSPQLSQISNGRNINTLKSSQNDIGSIVGTPAGFKGAGKRIASTPLERITSMDVVENAANSELQREGVSRKRRLEDLFGDIRDIEDDLCFGYESYVDPEVKKQKNEEERDLEMIEKILQARKRFRECKKPLEMDQLQKLNAVHEFKKRNLSRSVPNYPFLPLVRGRNDRIYVRFHSKEYENKELNELNVKRKGYSGFFGNSKETIWNEAQELVVKRLTSKSDTGNVLDHSTRNNAVEIVDENADELLWVEKYKPIKYIDLLSDESTNRNLLLWIKMWDKMVFGKEIKPKDIKGAKKINTFNKKTGRFESTGGWRYRAKQSLNENRDEYGRPFQKVALLCGPPGLGKTTLAHIIARHAGYNVLEMNASDDRNVEAFRQTLIDGTQSASFLNKGNRPNCIILDEIDGAPQQSIDFLLRFINDNVSSKAKKGGKGDKNILSKPIICICNDMYTPSLRQLRQIAFVVTFPPIENSKLAERLLQISRKENLETDLGTLLALAEKSGNDVRSCISMLQFYKATKKRLTLHDVLSSNFGQKDRHRGLFGVWRAIFQIQRPRNYLPGIDKNLPPGSKQIIKLTDMSPATRVKQILEIVHMEGDYERLMQGVFENYLLQKMPDPNLNGIVESVNWFCFSDEIQNLINHQQNYSIYPYLQFGFVAWHLLFAGLAWPKVNFPNKGFEYNQKGLTVRHIYQAFKRGINAGLIGIGHGHTLLLETIPHLKRILSPTLRSVSFQLLSSKERYDLKHVVGAMVDLGLAFNQIQTMDGTYKYHLEPDIDMLCQFRDSKGITLSYFGRQLIAREVELEHMRRITPKASSNKEHENRKNQEQKSSPKKPVANHLQTLQPRKTPVNPPRETISKDFFGRVVTKTMSTNEKEDCSNNVFKSPIWFRYKEGFNNAVRKTILMSDLI